MCYVVVGSGWIKKNDRTPLFLAFIRKGREVKTVGIENHYPYFYVEDDEGEEKSCYGTNISKVTVSSPDEVPREREKYKVTYEADIPYDMRVMIDRGIEYGVTDKLEPVDTKPIVPRILFFDIEVNLPPNELPDISNPKYPIVAISMYDNYDDEITILTYGSDKIYREEQINFDTEKEMLEKFANIIHEKDFDVVSGWYSEGFDIPYIMRRAKLKNADMSGCSRISTVYVSENRWFGRSKIDYMEYFKKWSLPMGKQDSYSLKAVSKKFANFSYTDYGSRIRELIDEGKWDVLVDYCVNDAIALKLIESSTGVIQFYENLRQMVGVKLEDCLSSSKIIEYLLMRRGVGKLPTRVFRDTVDKFEGAVVLSAPLGITNNVGVFDLKALYPSIILAFNLSPDVDKMIPKVIVELMDERNKMKEMRMNGEADEVMKVSEQSLKYIINSFYGYIGYRGSRLYDREIAKFITKTGRDIINSIRQVVIDNGLDVVYGDTDSTFVSPINSVEDGMEFERKINEYLLEWARDKGVDDDKAPIIEFEKLYRRILFKKKIGSDETAKKKYAGVTIWKDGVYEEKLDSKGIEFKRSDSSVLTKELIIDFLNKVLIEEDVDGGIELVRECWNKVKSGEVSLRDVALPKGVKKWNNTSSPWVKGVSEYEKLFDRKFDKNNTPRLIYCRKKNNICIDEDCEEGLVRDNYDIDWSLMAEKTVKKKMESFIESLGYSWDKSIDGQKDITEWFN